MGRRECPEALSFHMILSSELPLLPQLFSSLLNPYPPKCVFKDKRYQLFYNNHPILALLLPHEAKRKLTEQKLEMLVLIAASKQILVAHPLHPQPPPPPASTLQAPTSILHPSNHSSRALPHPPQPVNNGAPTTVFLYLRPTCHLHVTVPSCDWSESLFLGLTQTYRIRPCEGGSVRAGILDKHSMPKFRNHTIFSYDLYFRTR